MTAARWLIAYVALAAAFGTAAYHLTHFPEYAALASRGTVVKGVVIGSNCGLHGSYRYSFEAYGHWYSGSANGGIERDCAQLKAGDPVAVTYLPEAPAVSTTGDARQRRAHELIPGLLASVLFPAVILLRLRHHLRRKQARRSGRAVSKTGSTR